MFANLFFALREIGVTNAFMMCLVEMYVCNLVEIVSLVEICVPLVRLSISTRLSRLDFQN